MSEVDPHEVLNEARELARQGRYEEALRKHRWFHDHALEHEPALAGVRLSFALGDWVQLGEHYPPARQALVAVRDRTAGALAGRAGTPEAFHDVAAIDRALGEEARTADLFERLHRSDPALAGRCYRVAEESLVRGGAYETCLAYLPDPPERMDEILEMRRAMLAIDGEGPEFREVVDQLFVGDVSRLIAILRGVGRGWEAEQVRARAVAESEAARLALGDGESHDG